MELFITSVNDIMTVDETFVPTSNYERETTDVVCRKEITLKSYRPSINVLLSPSEKFDLIEEFKRDNRGLVGKGDTVLLLGEDGTLTEFYSGVHITPVDSRSIATQGSNHAEAVYYGINQDADSSKLYVPFESLRKIDGSNSLSVLEKLFLDKNRDVENEIIKPLQNRDALAKKNSKHQANVDVQSDVPYNDEVQMHHNR